jgi:penicillin-binding protein 1C
MPLLTGARARATLLPMPGTGFVTLSVIDARGQAARVSVRLVRP